MEVAGRIGPVTMRGTRRNVYEHGERVRAVDQTLFQRRKRSNPQDYVVACTFWDTAVRRMQCAIHAQWNSHRTRQCQCAHCRTLWIVNFHTFL